MALTGLPPNSSFPWAAPPAGHHMNTVWFSTANGTGPPYCVDEQIRFALCSGGGDCYMSTNAASPNFAPYPNGYGQQYPISWFSNLGGTSNNSWGQSRLTFVTYQLLDANGIGVETSISMPATSSAAPPYQFVNDFSPLSNSSPGYSDSHIYQATSPGLVLSQNLPNVPSESGLTPLGTYAVPFGNYTFKIWNLQAECYHTSLPVSATNPSVHPVPIGQGNAPGNTYSIPITITDSPGSFIQTNWSGQGWSGCGPAVYTPASWFCSNHRCVEIIRSPNTVTSPGLQMMDTEVFSWIQSHPSSPAFINNLFAGVYNNLTTLDQIMNVGPVTLPNGNSYNPLHDTQGLCAMCCTAVDSIVSGPTNSPNPYYAMNTPPLNPGYEAWLLNNNFSNHPTNLKDYLLSIGENSCGQF